MIKRLLASIVMLALALTSGFAMHAPAYAQEDPACIEADTYVRSVHTLQLVFNAAIGDLDQNNFQNWTQEEMDTGLQAANSMVTSLTALTAPPAAEEVHAALTGFYQTWTDLLDTFQQAGLIAVLPLLEDFTEVSESINAAGITFEEACQVALIDNDDDGFPEIGAGEQLDGFTSGEIDPNAPLGSFENPIPVGQTGGVGGGWEITVVDVRPDDTEAVMDENSFNEPPIEGRQFFVVDVMVENVGTTPASFDGNFRLRATGLEGTYRAFAPDDRCGVVPNEWEEVEIAPGEQVTAAICWSVPATDAANIRLFDHDAITEARVYFALTPADAATPDAETGVQTGSVSRVPDDEATPVPGT